MSDNKARRKAEFGDFQTPLSLAKEVCLLLRELGCNPVSVLEPTCGEGNFITASLAVFENATSILGFDINPDYTNILETKYEDNSKVKISQSDFFYADWEKVLGNLSDNLLIIGNPPWVTNSELASFDSNNLPEKVNFQNHSGLDAITGASNFDISEWMLIKMLEWVRTREATVAMLCKTAVARKVLLHEWKNNPNSRQARIFLINAMSDFGAAVDACLLVYNSNDRKLKVCDVYSKLSTSSKIARFGYEKNQLIARVDFYEKWGHLQKRKGEDSFTWRSGIKHDCSKVMELTQLGSFYVNNLGEQVDIEETYLYPMMKSSDVANVNPPSRYMLVTQKFVGQETNAIKDTAPRTWNYLSEHLQYFDKRKSSIYKDKPPFSIFGVGDYSFSAWKVAVSGLYKKLNFIVVGPFDNKPVVLDDTCYFLACKNSDEAKTIATLLNSEPANEFFESLIFWDAKRPVTARILQKLSIMALARTVISDSNQMELFARPEQLRLLEQRAVYGL